MKQSTASVTLTIKVVTGFAFALNLGMFIAAYFHPPLIFGGLVVTASIVGCYFFWAPVAYELIGDELIVTFRVGSVRYRPVTKCSVLTEPVRCALRVCGNGGLFAGSGIFWNRQFGFFRAFVTTNKPGEMVLVETSQRKIIISPVDPQAWVTAR